MSKVFRFHKGEATLEDWAATTVYGKSEIEGIADPTGATASKQITSIPSPFARIDLVQTAFFYTAQKEHPLDGNTIYHRLVSDALDLGEILFNIDQLKSQFNIIPWDKTNDLNALLQHSNPKQRLYGETLKLFLDQDAKAYNFDLLQRFYLVEHNHKIIGGTSPATLFFTTANDISHVKIQFGNDRVFDASYQPLYKRDPEYQQYLHHLFKAYPEMSRRMKEVQDYLNRSLEMLNTTNPALYGTINRLQAKDFTAAYDELNTGTAGDTVDVLGFPLRKRHKASIVNSVKDSDFVIRSAKYTGEYKPLVLQNNFNDPKREMRYTTDPWDKDTKVPYFDAAPLHQRKLPDQIIEYPYLTVSDFLEPHLLRTIYPLNSRQYFDGNFKMESGDPGKGYLLPLTPLFFTFFSADELRGKMHDGKPMMEMMQRALNSVTVILRIPIQKEGKYITFERTYFPPLSESEMAIANPAQNKGAVMEGFFNVVVLPFFRHPEGVVPDYRIMIIDKDTDGYKSKSQYELTLYNDEGLMDMANVKRRNRSDKKAGDLVSTAFYITPRNFRFITVQNGIAKGIVLPLLPDVQPGMDAFHFAIDFGTTNTHVEWKKEDDGGGKNTYPLEITPADLQYAGLINPDEENLVLPELRYLIEHELFPPVIGKGQPYHFPQRTLLSFSKGTGFADGSATYCLSDFNIPFIYERQSLRRNTAIRSNLKWSEETGNQVLVRRFFENLIVIMRNKILLNGGNPGATKITTFFPSSMDEGRRRAFNDILSKPQEGVLWQYFPTTVTHTSISESLAPYYFAANTLTISSSDRPVVNIDIGGGTTDIMVFFKEQPAFLSSFRFAAYALFGDAFNASSRVNGFVQKYFKGLDGKGGYRGMVEGVFPVPSIFREMEDHSSADIMSFLFSLADNSDLAKGGKKISLFNDLSNDRDMKALLVLFSGAILYHLAQCMRHKSLPYPKTILLSGNGSKIMTMAEGATGFDGMQDFAAAIFKKFYPEEKSLRIKITQEENPKELTCKGGLYFKPEVLLNSFNKDRAEEDKITNLGRVMDALKFTHYGGAKSIADIKLRKETAGDTTTKNEALTYAEVEQSAACKKAVLEEVTTCIDFLFNLLNENSLGLSGIFRINDALLDKIQVKCKEALVEDFELGITEKIKELGGKTDRQLDETLFFYPFIGAINKTAHAIVVGQI
jgi:hypothetical protein